VQVKARCALPGDEDRERAWIERKVNTAARQAAGTIRKLSSGKHPLANERGAIVSRYYVPLTLELLVTTLADACAQVGGIGIGHEGVGWTCSGVTSSIGSAEASLGRFCEYFERPQYPDGVAPFLAEYHPRLVRTGTTWTCTFEQRVAPISGR
jgi:hypothetical protein